MDFQRLGGTVSAKGKFHPASSMKMNSSMGFLENRPMKENGLYLKIHALVGLTVE